MSAMNFSIMLQMLGQKTPAALRNLPFHQYKQANWDKKASKKNTWSGMDHSVVTGHNNEV